MANELTEREQWIASLRELATWLSEHPDLPCPTYSGFNMNVFVNGSELGTLAREHRPWEKVFGQSYFSLVKRFGPHSYEANIDRSQVCERVVTGKRLVPAQPEHEEETYEWKCSDVIISAL